MSATSCGVSGRRMSMPSTSPAKHGPTWRILTGIVGLSSVVKQWDAGDAACFWLAPARIARRLEPEVIAEMRAHALGPRRVCRCPPLARMHNFGRCQMIERGIALFRAGTAVAAGRQHAPDAAKRGDVLGIVPFVEFGLGLRRDIHRD